MSMMAGITENYFVGIKSGVTTRWIVEVWELYAETIFLSLMISIACLGVDLILGIPTAYVLAKKSGRAARIIEEFLVLPIAIPGLAIALALIIMYGGFRDFRSSWGFILVGHVLYTLPFMVRSVLAVLSSIDFRTLEEGAASLGAGFLATIFYRHFAQYPIWNTGRVVNGDHLVDWRVQFDLDASHSTDKDIASRIGRCLCFDAT